MSIIQSKVDLVKLKIEIYHARNRKMSLAFPCTLEYLNECHLFDSVFKRVLKICRKNSKEVEHDKERLIWFVVVDALQAIMSNPVVSLKRYCREFF